jgi:hypothetical protein
MAQISSIGAGIYTSLAYIADDVNADTASEFLALSMTSISNVRDFPAFLAPANIVNVPAYGQKQSSQIAGQADAPTLEFTINYVPSVHNAINTLVGNGLTYIFRIRLANAPLPATLLSTTEHTDFYVRGKFASFQVTPSLSDSNQAKIALSTQGDYWGPYTTP